MADGLSGQWIGDLRGTDIGNVFATVAENEEIRSISLTANLTRGIVRLVGSIDRDGQVLTAKLAPDPTFASDVAIPKVRIFFDQVDAVRLVGRWESDAGNAGVIFLNRSETKVQQGSTISVTKPVQIMTREDELPSLTLMRTELEVLVEKLKEIIGGSNDVVIAAKLGDKEVRSFANDFFKSQIIPTYTRQISLSLADRRQPIASTISINMREAGGGSVAVQSDNGVWVSGAFTEIVGYLRPFRSNFIHLFQRHGLNLNLFLLLAAIVLLPDPSLPARIIMLTLSICLMLLFFRVHRFLSLNMVYFDKSASRGFFGKYIPSLASSLSAATITAILAWAYNYATPKNIEWLIIFLTRN